MCTTGSACLIFFFFWKWTYSTEIVLTVSVLVFHHIYVLKPCSKVFWHAFCKLAYMTIKYEECCLLFSFFHITSAGSPEPTALNTASASWWKPFFLYVTLTVHAFQVHCNLRLFSAINVFRYHLKSLFLLMIFKALAFTSNVHVGETIFTIYTNVTSIQCIIA